MAMDDALISMVKVGAEEEVAVSGEEMIAGNAWNVTMKFLKALHSLCSTAKSVFACWHFARLLLCPVHTQL